MLFGDVPYDDMFESNDVVGPLLFLMFMLGVTLVLVNILIAVIGEVYMRLQSENLENWERMITKRLMQVCLE